MGMGEFGHQNNVMSYQYFPKSMDDYLSLKEIKALQYDEDKGFTGEGGKSVEGVLPVFPKDRGYQELVAFVNVGDPREELAKGDYIKMTKETLGKAGEESYYVTAIAFRGHKPIIHSVVNVSRKKPFDIRYNYTPEFAVLEMERATEDAKNEELFAQKKISRAELNERLEKSGEKRDRKLKDKTYTTLSLDCTIE